MRITNWNNKEIVIAQSKGGVIATAHPYDNLIRPDCVIWPPPEIIQKLYKSRHSSSFLGKNGEICSSGLGYYCDLQSINSEDAITWSVFGTVARASKCVLKAWIADVLRLIDLHQVQAEDAEIFLWRRLPHPDILVPGGPEIDAGILTKNAVILIEAKWLSGIGSNQGKMKDKDQIQLRGEFLAKYGPQVFPPRKEFVVIGISLFPKSFKDITSERGVIFRSATWEQICGLGSHPNAEELARYFEWKKNSSSGIT